MLISHCGGCLVAQCPRFVSSMELLYAWVTEDYRRQRKFVFGDPFSTSMNMGGRVHSGKLT